MTLESDFHNAMVNIYVRARRECSYNATRFLQMLDQPDGLAAAHRLLAADSPQYGFTELWQLGRLDLTMESLVLEGGWKSPFSDEERQRARERLAGFDGVETKNVEGDIFNNYYIACKN